MRATIPHPNTRVGKFQEIAVELGAWEKQLEQTRHVDHTATRTPRTSEGPLADVNHTAQWGFKRIPRPPILVLSPHLCAYVYLSESAAASRRIRRLSDRHRSAAGAFRLPLRDEADPSDVRPEPIIRDNHASLVRRGLNQDTRLSLTQLLPGEFAATSRDGLQRSSSRAPFRRRRFAPQYLVAEPTPAALCFAV